MVIPMKKDCKNSPNRGPTSICIMLDCNMDKPDVVDPCIAADDTAGICHDLLRHVEHRHDDVKSIVKSSRPIWQF